MSEAARERDRRMGERRQPRRSPTADESWFGAFGSAEDTQVSQYENSPEMKAKFERGPVGSMIVRPGSGMGMGKALGIWFVFCLIVASFVAYLAGHALPHGAAAGKVVQMTGAAAFLGHAFAQWHDWTWKGLSFGTMVKFAIDGVVYTAITAATFAWLWPAAN